MPRATFMIITPTLPLLEIKGKSKSKKVTIYEESLNIKTPLIRPKIDVN